MDDNRIRINLKGFVERNVNKKDKKNSQTTIKSNVAPELKNLKNTFTKKTDVFALGSVLYELCELKQLTDEQ